MSRLAPCNFYTIRFSEFFLNKPNHVRSNKIWVCSDFFFIRITTYASAMKDWGFSHPCTMYEQCMLWVPCSFSHIRIASPQPRYIGFKKTHETTKPILHVFIFSPYYVVARLSMASITIVILSNEHWHPIDMISIKLPQLIATMKINRQMYKSMRPRQ
jgi:hypothetical protein